MPEESLLGSILKRQRVNSAATKQEFSFMPTLENKIDSSLSFRPTPVQNKRRDQKAAMKVKQWNEDRLPLPKLVEIKVPDLTNLPSEHNPIRQPPSSSKDPQMPHTKKKPALSGGRKMFVTLAA